MNDWSFPQLAYLIGNTLLDQNKDFFVKYKTRIRTALFCGSVIVGVEYVVDSNAANRLVKFHAQPTQKVFNWI